MLFLLVIDNDDDDDDDDDDDLVLTNVRRNFVFSLGRSLSTQTT